MLVLTRKENEKIRIGDDIVLTVVRTSGDRVRIGIEAPTNIQILRSELKTDNERLLVGGQWPVNADRATRDTLAASYGT